MSALPRNITVLSHRLPYPPNKGEKIRTFNQLEYLRQLDCSVTLFCPIESEEDKQLAHRYATMSGFNIITAAPRFRKLSMLVGLLTGRALSVSNFYCSKLQQRVDTHLASEPVDAVYCTSSAMAEYWFRSTRRSGTDNLKASLLMDFMDLDSDKWRQYREISRFPMSMIYHYEAVALARYEKKIQQSFDACLFISQNEVALFRESLPGHADNLHVIGNGVDLTAFRPRAGSCESGFGTAEPGNVINLPNAGLRLLFSGVMDYLPNENAMLWFVENVWDRLRQVRPDAELIIAGMNPSQAIQALATQEGVTVTGFVDDMLACYHDATLFVAPFQIARGVQNKVLQAFACGLPVVTTAVGAEGIDCTDGVHYALASTPEEFVQQIIKLSDDPAYYGQVAGNAIELVNQQYTWAAMNSELAQLFITSSVEAA